jgi:hypothetical protein
MITKSTASQYLRRKKCNDVSKEHVTCSAGSKCKSKNPEISQQKMDCCWFVRLQQAWKRQVGPKRQSAFTVRRLYNAEEMLSDKCNFLNLFFYLFLLKQGFPQFPSSLAHVTVL